MSVRRATSTTSLSKYARANSPDLSQRSLDFCNAFWGIGDGGVDVLFARMRGATRTMDELKSFWKERSAIEEEYAKKMGKLAKISMGKDEIGELRNSLDTLRLETDKQANYHQQLAQQIRRDLEVPAADFVAKQTQHKKTFQSNIEKEFKIKQTREQHANKAREKYESDCLRINSYTAQSTLVQGKDLEKIHLKLERAQQTVQVNENDYAQFTRVYQETALKWEQDWKAFCDSCQDLEEERMEFMKDNMWAYANAVSTVCVSDDESCEKMRLALEQMEPDKDMENFVRDYGTGNAIPEAPAFINYADTDAPLPVGNRLTTRNANFGRATQRTPASRNTTQQPEDEMTDNRAGVGAGGWRNEVPPDGSLTRSGTQTYQNGRPTNGDPAGVNGSSRSPQPDLARRASTRTGPKPTQDRNVDPIDPTVGSTMLVVGKKAYTVDPSNDPQQQKGTQVRSSPPVGEQNDPLVQQMAELASAANGANRRGSMRNPHTNAQPQGQVRKTTGSDSLSLSTPSPSNGGPDSRQAYRKSAEIVVGSYPIANSRPASPNPPTAALVAPPPQMLPPTASTVPVEKVVNNYQRPFPGETRSRSNSYRQSTTAPSPNQEQNGPRPTSRQGYAGIGTTQPVSRSVSPANQPMQQYYHAPPSNQSLVRAPSISQPPPPPPQQRSVTPNTVGIILGPDGSVRQDSMYGSSVPQQYNPNQAQQTRNPQYHPINQSQQRPYDTAPVGPPTNYTPHSYAPPPPHAGYNQPPPPSAHYHPPAAYTAPPSQGGYAVRPYGVQSTAVTQPPNNNNNNNNMYPTHYGNNGYGNSPVRSPSPQPPRHAPPPTGAYTDDGRPILFYVKALYDYGATIDEEFDFQAGDIIAVTDTPEDGWWSGELLDEARRQTGRHVFPSNFVCLF